jgi:hypothetical protein
MDTTRLQNSTPHPPTHTTLAGQRIRPSLVNGPRPLFTNGHGIAHRWTLRFPKTRYPTHRWTPPSPTDGYNASSRHDNPPTDAYNPLPPAYTALAYQQHVPRSPTDTTSHTNGRDASHTDMTPCLWMDAKSPARVDVTLAHRHFSRSFHLCTFICFYVFTAVP